LLFAADPVQTILPHFQTISNYDPLKDYTPIGTLVDSVFGIFVNQDSKIKSLSDLIAAAKANPGQLKYGSAGIGSGNQLVTMLLEQKTGTKMLHVPFSGGAPANLALLSGSVDFMIISISSVLDQIEAGKLKALAVASAQRQKSLPNVPTADEAGVKDYTASSWFGLQGPPGLPPAIVATLNDAMKKALKDPDFASATAKLGYSPEVGAPETMKQRIDTSYKLWGDLVKAANQNATK
jgi:tripartite-type tricarboxylate transporter receptor subunit TctC